jgi:hypothetical protein
MLQLLTAYFITNTKKNVFAFNQRDIPPYCIQYFYIAALLGMLRGRGWPFVTKLTIHLKAKSMRWGRGNKRVVKYKTCFQRVPVLFHRSEQRSADLR